MTDRQKITAILAILIVGLAVVLIGAARSAYAGSWLQAYGKQGACADGWGESWQEWAVSVTGGAVCTREVDDPSQPVAAAGPTLPPWPSGREFLYSGNRIVNGVLGGGSGFTYVSSPFSICTTWSAARVTSANNLVTVDSWSNNSFIYVYNAGNQTTINLYVTCA